MLRQKIEKDPTQRRILVTGLAVGYRLALRVRCELLEIFVR
jgi:hypothetical protein